MERRASEKGEKEKGNVSARRSFSPSFLQEVFYWPYTSLELRLIDFSNPLTDQ
jgi:hypothetical protein